MKQEKSQRRASTASRRPSSASAILSGKSAGASTDYFSFGWMLLFATFLTITLVSFLFTPYTHQLDEIKNVLLMLLPPMLLGATLLKMDFSALTWKKHGALMLLGLYFLWMWISWLVNPYKAMGERVIWFNVAVSTFTLVFALFMNTEDKVRKTMIFFVTLGLVSTVLGLFLFAGRYTEGFYTKMLTDPYWQTEARRPWATLVYTLMSSSSDMYSFILNSDFYAAFLVMLIPIALSMFFVEQRTGFKILALAAVLLMNVCLVLTNSNDSFISMFLFAYPLYFLLGYKYVNDWGLSRRFVLTFAGCTAALLVLIGILMLPKLSATFDFKSAAFEGRRVLWGGGFWPWIYGDNLKGQGADLISIIFGTGPGGYRHYFPWFRRPDFFDQQINNVTTFSHNFYLDVLLETGLVGLVLFIGFVVRVYADGIRQIRTTASRTHLLYQLAILIGLTGIAVQNYSSPNNRWAVAGMIYWCMFGLSLGMSYLETPAVPGENAEKKIAGFPVYKGVRWASLALAALFFWRCILPGGQFLDYWNSAKQNAEGLRDMEQASYANSTPEQQMTSLAQAMAHFETAIRKNPTFATSYYKLGHVYNQVGQLTDNPEYSDKAIQTYEDLNEVNPNYSEVHLNLGIMYAQKAGSLQQDKVKLQREAVELMQQMQSATAAQRQELESRYGALQEQLKKMEGDEAATRLQLMERSYDHMKEAAHQSLKPNTQYLTGSIGRELASIYEQQGDEEKAEALKEEIKKYFRSLLEYTPKLAELQGDHRTYYTRAQSNLLALAEETKNVDETIAVLKQMVEDNPDNDVMLEALLEAYDRADKTDEKLKYLVDATHANPTDPKLRQELAQAYKLAGQQEKYINELRRVEVLQPEDQEVLKELHQAYTASGDQQKVQEYSDKLTSVGATLDNAATTASAQATTATAAVEPDTPSTDTAETATLAAETTGVAATTETTDATTVPSTATTATAPTPATLETPAPAPATAPTATPAPAATPAAGTTTTTPAATPATTPSDSTSTN